MRRATCAGSVWLAALGGVLGAASAGCSSTCPDGDFDCLVKSMVFYDLGTQGSADPDSTTYQAFEPSFDSVADGPLEVVWVKADSLPSTSPPTTPAPTITNQPEPIRLGTSSSVGVVKLDFTDPNGSQPYLCNCLHPPDPSSVSPMFPRGVSPQCFCTRGKYDGHRVGRMYLGYRVESVPETTTETVQDDIFPISGDGGQDLFAGATSGDGSVDDPSVLGPNAASGLAVGGAVSLMITVVSEAVAGEGGSGQCSGWTGCCTSDQMRACSNGDASSCWYEFTSGARVECSGCDCGAAAVTAAHTCCP
jgi:hypothetical protein